MLVSFQAKLAFLAMTKSGSTAIQNALSRHCDMIFTKAPRATHMPFQRFNRFIRPYLNAIGETDIETCCVMRHPVAWLGSWYQYRQIDRLWEPPVRTSGMSFEAFAGAVVAGTDPGAHHMGRQHRFVVNWKGAVGVDRIFRYEDMPAFERFLSARFGTPIRFQHENVSPQAPLGLSPDTMAAVEAHCAADFEIYDALGAPDGQHPLLGKPLTAFAPPAQTASVP